MKRGKHSGRLLGAVACAALLTIAPGAHCAQVLQLKTVDGVLEGTLRKPDAAMGQPLVLVLPGSGATDRDGNGPAGTGKTDSYKQLAEGLAGTKIASFTFDKRGVGASAQAAPPEFLLGFDTYVRDAEAWIDRLSMQPGIDGIVLAGHSEGGLMAMLVAQHRPGKVIGVVLLNTSSEDALTLLRRQAHNLPGNLVPDAERILQSLATGTLTPEVPAVLQPLYRLTIQPYLLSWMKYDPLQEIARIEQPLLIINGSADLQVEAAAPARLHAARPGSRMVILPAMNHVLKLVLYPGTDQNAEYTDPSRPLHPALVNTLAGFVANLRHRSAVTE